MAVSVTGPMFSKVTLACVKGRLQIPVMNNAEIPVSIRDMETEHFLFVFEAELSVSSRTESYQPRLALATL